MKRIFTALLALTLLFALALPVFATSERALVWDETGRKVEADAEAVAKLNETAKKLQTHYGIVFSLVYVDGNAADYKPEDFYPNEEHYVLFIVGDTNNRLYTKGVADEVFADPDDRDRMGYVYDEMDLWQEAGARYFEILEEYCQKYSKKQQEENPTPAPSPSQAESLITEAGKKEEATSTAVISALIATAAVIVVGVAILFIRKKKA